MLPKFSRYGGVEQFGYRLAALLASRGHSVDFICARQEAEAPDGVRVITVGRPPGFRVVKLLWFLLAAERERRKGDYDLSISLGKNWRQDLTRMGGGPLKVFWRESERAVPPGPARWKKRWQRRLSPNNWLTLLVERHQFGKSSEVVAVSHLVRGWLLEAHAELRPENVTVIYNRPDTGRFHPPSPEARAAARQALLVKFPADMGRNHPSEAGGEDAPAGTGPVIIGTASTNFQLKGVEPLIRALAKLPPEYRLCVAGKRDHAVYDRLAESLGVADRVCFLGRVDDMPSFYQSLDLFVLPTFYDACSNAVLEALASGCRVLSGRSNGSAFFLDEASVLPDPGDADDLAGRIAAAMKQPVPEPFVWPAGVPSGVEAFADLVEERLKGKGCGTPGPRGYSSACPIPGRGDATSGCPSTDQGTEAR